MATRVAPTSGQSGSYFGRGWPFRQRAQYDQALTRKGAFLHNFRRSFLVCNAAFEQRSRRSNPRRVSSITLDV